MSKPERGREPLCPQHERSLAVESNIAPEVIAARDYRTVTVKAELRRLGFSERQCLVPALLLPLWGVGGEVIGYQARPDSPRVKDGKTVKYETPVGMKMVLDVHPSVRRLLADPAVPLFVTEGVKKGDALASHGYCAVALLGVWNWRGTNEAGGKVALGEWESVALNGRRVYVAFDSDVMLKVGVHAALSRLKGFLESRGANLAVIYLPAGSGGAKVGIDDYLATGKTIDDLLAMATPELRPVLDASPSTNAEMDEADGRRSQATALVEIGSQAELFHDSSGTAFARLRVEGHSEAWPLQSKRFKNWLRREYYMRQHRAPNSDAVHGACGVLEGIASFDGAQIELHNRVAWFEGAIYYDLADAQWRVIRVHQDGWEVVEPPPILFRRHAHQRPQVDPVPGGDVRAVLDFLNVRREDQLLSLVWLVAAFVPDIPHPIPEYYGEKGSGKSVGQRVLRRLIDPSRIESLAFPSDVRELVQQLSHHYAPVYDNVDRLPPWISNILCRAVTGEGFSKRELYSDDEDVIYSYRRVVMLNGVNIVARRPDLLDRSILVGLDRISRTDRREERAFWARFEEARPYILGGIFDALSSALRIYPALDLPVLERMADFTRWGAAIAEALGYGSEAFLRAYASNLGVQTLEAVQGHIVGAAVLSLMDGLDEWSGSPAELLQALEDAGEEARLFKRAASGRVDAKGWPGAPHILSRRLNEIRSNLADLGFDIVQDRGDERVVTIRRRPQSSESSVGSDGSDGAIEANPIHRDATDATDAKLAPLGGEEWEAVIE